MKITGLIVGYDPGGDNSHGMAVLGLDDGQYRVVDVERGFFNLIQNGKLVYAHQLYNAACLHQKRAN